jgi:hypothetical protein
MVVQQNSTRQTPSASPPIICPMSEVEILHNNHIITSRLPHLIKKFRHTNDIQQAILRQTKWDLTSFNKVDWSGHKAAFTCHGRIHRISTAKLIHGLYQTTEQDNLGIFQIHLEILKWISPWDHP